MSVVSVSAVDWKRITEKKSAMVSVLITAFAAAIMSSPRPFELMEPETSRTSTTSLGPDEAATYHGLTRGS